MDQYKSQKLYITRKVYVLVFGSPAFNGWLFTTGSKFKVIQVNTVVKYLGFYFSRNENSEFYGILK